VSLCLWWQNGAEYQAAMMTFPLLPLGGAFTRLPGTAAARRATTFCHRRRTVPALHAPVFIANAIDIP